MHPILRLVLYPAVILIVLPLCMILMFVTEPGQGRPDRGSLPNLVWITTLLSLFALDGWLTYRCRWHYWRGGTEIGTFSASQLNQLYKTGQIDSKTPIRQVKDDGWHTGLALEEPPRRLVKGSVYGMLALFLGFPLCFGLFGHVQGNYLRVDQLFGELDPVQIGYLNGLTKGQMQQMGLVRAGVLVGEITPTPWAPAAEQAANYIDRSYDRMERKVERAQSLTLGGTTLLALLGTTVGAVTARGRARIIKERRVKITKRNSSGEATS